MPIRSKSMPIRSSVKSVMRVEVLLDEEPQCLSHKINHDHPSHPQRRRLYLSSWRSRQSEERLDSMLMNALSALIDQIAPMGLPVLGQAKEIVTIFFSVVEPILLDSDWNAQEVQHVNISFELRDHDFCHTCFTDEVSPVFFNV